MIIITSKVRSTDWRVPRLSENRINNVFRGRTYVYMRVFELNRVRLWASVA